MTIYGEEDLQFRPRPSRAALVATTLSQALVSAQLTALVLTAVVALLANLRKWSPEWVFFAPFADEPILPAFTPSDDALSLASLAGAVAALFLGVIIANFWPTDQKLSIRLFVYTFATSLIVYGTVPIAFAPSRFKLFAAVPTLVSAAFTGIVAAWLVMRIEKRIIEMMGGFFTTTTPAKRLGLWAIRIPMPFALIGALAWLNGDRPRAYAAGVAIVATLLENLSRVPASTFERVSEPHLREAAATFPIIALILLGGSIWLFGLDAAKVPGRAVVASSKGVELVRVSELARAAEARRKEEEPKIQIWWSKEKATGNRQ
ncbi:MAG TPA: hypothetical protein VIL97_08030 [Thermoanaerobaculia bacterium]